MVAVALSAIAAVVVRGAGANVQATVLPTLASSTQFDVTGFLQTATVDTPSDPHSGGTLTVNGHKIVVPRETIAILPASALTWQELFTHAPAPWAGTDQTGMALNDSPKPDTTYEVHVVGNRVIDANGDRYIAGLVDISQQDLNSGAGYVNYINYATGEMMVGGTLGDSGTGTRIAINDPATPTSGSGGRYGRAMTPDDRFQVDQDNPTILAETGFPMCIPRVAPSTTTDDALCPQANRPAVSNPVVDTSGITPQPNTLIAGEHYRMFRMDSPANVDAGAGCLRTPCADPRQQAPFELGDYVTFAGNVETDSTGRYISAHTIVASLGIYTQPGVDPAYDTVDVSLIGHGRPDRVRCRRGRRPHPVRGHDDRRDATDPRVRRRHQPEHRCVDGPRLGHDPARSRPAQRRRARPLALPPAVHRHRRDAEGVHAAGLRPVHPGHP